MILSPKLGGKFHSAFPFSAQLQGKIQKLNGVYGYGFMGPLYEIIACIEMIAMLKKQNVTPLREEAGLLSQKRMFKQIALLLSECRRDLRDAVTVVILLVQEYRDTAFTDAVQDKCFALWRKDNPERETHIVMAQECMAHLQTQADTVPRYIFPYDTWQAHNLNTAELNTLHNCFLRIDL